MQKAAISLIALGLGLVVGGAGAYGTDLMMHQSLRPRTMVFLPTGDILAPLVSADGRLASYVTITAQIEIPSDREEDIKRNLPVLINAINMRTYRAPMASGKDGLVPRLDLFRNVVKEAADETLGPGVVARVAITHAGPL
ncbi:MAG TPA: hypothetical protein VF503_04090 [Sphingobium sp.]|uniref:hypothetical protein n=1 Tax=Sphingobium sp. TaxID=1912891 RepID=UPI002ECFDAEF